MECSGLKGASPSWALLYCLVSPLRTLAQLLYMALVLQGVSWADVVVLTPHWHLSHRCTCGS